jgi:NAD(P)H-dependent FMN reductase
MPPRFEIHLVEIHQGVRNMQKPLRLALIYGSAREGRFCDIVVAWVRDRIEAHGGFSVDLIDPRTIDQNATATLRARVDQADAFVVVTPEYNHGYPADLKRLIDQVYDEWQAKPVAFVSYGGISGGLRAVEQLRLVFAELHATTVRDSVSFAEAWSRFDDQGRLREPERAQRSMSTMLEALTWWATVLRFGRQTAPYASRAA